MKNAQNGLLLSILLMVAPASLLAQTAAFTYQGRLVDGSQPANGNYDLQFRLADSASSSNYVGVTVTNAAVTDSNGLFSVTLDFGASVFDGSARWLEIGVRTNGSAGPYTVLSPRQSINRTPYATFANTAASAAVTIADVVGVLGPGTNTTYRTNNGRVYIDTGSGGGSGLAGTPDSITVFPSNTTAQIQGALDSVSKVRFAPGNYTLTSLIIRSGNDIDLSGAHLTFNGTSSGYLFTTDPNGARGVPTFIRGGMLDGGESEVAWETNPKSVPTPPVFCYPNMPLPTGGNWFSNRSGMFIDVSMSVHVRDVEIMGFSGFGMFICHSDQTTGGAVPVRGSVGRLEFHHNHIGLMPQGRGWDTYPNLGPDAPTREADYLIFSGLYFHNNTIGAMLGVANHNVTSCIFLSNWLAVEMQFAYNDCHGLFANNTLNHNNNGIYAVSAVQGEEILNNTFQVNGGTCMIFDQAINFNVRGNRILPSGSSGPTVIQITNTLNAKTGFFFFEDNTYWGTWGGSTATDLLVLTNAGNITVKYRGNHSTGGTNTDGTFAWSPLLSAAQIAATNAPSAGQALRYDGTNMYWSN